MTFSTQLLGHFEFHQLLSQDTYPFAQQIRLLHAGLAQHVECHSQFFGDRCGPLSSTDLDIAMRATCGRPPRQPANLHPSWDTTRALPGSSDCLLHVFAHMTDGRTETRPAPHDSGALRPLACQLRFAQSFTRSFLAPLRPLRGERLTPLALREMWMFASKHPFSTRGKVRFNTWCVSHHEREGEQRVMLNVEKLRH